MLIAGKRVNGVMICDKLRTTKGVTRLGELKREGFPINSVLRKTLVPEPQKEYWIDVANRDRARKLFTKLYGKEAA
jgi:hypothetical protein